MLNASMALPIWTFLYTRPAKSRDAVPPPSNRPSLSSRPTSLRVTYFFRPSGLLLQPHRIGARRRAQVPLFRHRPKSDGAGCVATPRRIVVDDTGLEPVTPGM